MGDRFLEGCHAVADGLHTGQGRAASAVGPGQQPEGGQLRGALQVDRGRVGNDHLVAGGNIPEALGQQAQDADHEAVGGQAEDEAALLHAPEVHEADEADDGLGQEHPVGFQAREGGDDGGHASGYGHGHGQDVVDEERGPRGLGRDLTQVVLGDQVGTAPAGVGVDSLAVAHVQNQQQAHDADGHPPGPAEDPSAEDRDGRREGRHDLLGAVGDGGQRVGAEHRQGDGVADPGLVALFAGEAAAKEQGSEVGHGWAS